MVKKILVIDDEQDLVKLLKTRLEADHYEVIAAYDGKMGLEKWREEKPHLIILDIMMPEIDGYSFVQESKTRPELNPCPIIVLTARPGMQEIFEVEGVKDYIVKPFDGEDLLRKIHRYLGG